MIYILLNNVIIETNKESVNPLLKKPLCDSLLKIYVTTELYSIIRSKFGIQCHWERWL